jgi:hypothetical protein
VAFTIRSEVTYVEDTEHQVCLEMSKTDEVKKPVLKKQNNHYK